jgi:hypothetical protein
MLRIFLSCGANRRNGALVRRGKAIGDAVATGISGLAGSDFDGDRFAGQHRLIEEQRAFDNAQVRRRKFAKGDARRGMNALFGNGIRAEFDESSRSADDRPCGTVPFGPSRSFLPDFILRGRSAMRETPRNRGLQ